MDSQIDALIALVKQGYQPDSPTHDVSHLARVAALGTRLAADEGADPMVVVCAAWLHDLHRDRKAAAGTFFASPEEFDDRARDFMDMAEIPVTVHKDVLNAVHYTDRFSFSDRFPDSAAPEARCVRDADNLDAIGAIGVARAFSFGGAHDIPIWEPDVPVEQGVFRQTAKPRSTIHHFHEKLIRLVGEFETRTAKKLAQQRSAYLAEFARQLKAEWSEDFEHEE